jgi:homoserine kinase type II
MAQYSELTEANIREACGLYDVEVTNYAHLAGGAANTSFEIESGEQRFVLTVLDNTSHLKFPVDVLPETLAHLNTNRVPTNVPVRSKNGRFVENYSEHTILLKSLVLGDCFNALPEQYLAAAGSALARLHSVPALQDLPRGARRLHNADDYLSKFDDAEFASWVRESLHKCEKTLPHTGNSIIHGDFASDNLVVTSAGDIAILDWETASIDAPVIDIGWAIVGLCCAGGKLDLSRRESFLSGYESVRPLNNDEQRCLRTAAVYAATVLGFYRYVRQHIRFPNPAKFDIYKEMWNAAEDIEAHWPVSGE